MRARGEFADQMPPSQLAAWAQRRASQLPRGLRHPSQLTPGARRPSQLPRGESDGVGERGSMSEGRERSSATRDSTQPQNACKLAPTRDVSGGQRPRSERRSVHEADAAAERHGDKERPQTSRSRKNLLQAHGDELVRGESRLAVSPQEPPACEASFGSHLRRRVGSIFGLHGNSHNACKLAPMRDVSAGDRRTHGLRRSVHEANSTAERHGDKERPESSRSRRNLLER